LQGAESVYQGGNRGGNQAPISGALRIHLISILIIKPATDIYKPKLRLAKPAIDPTASPRSTSRQSPLCPADGAEAAHPCQRTVEGISQATMRLGDHSAAGEIEAAVNDGRPFAEAFSRRRKPGGAPPDVLAQRVSEPPRAAVAMAAPKAA